MMDIPKGVSSAYCGQMKAYREILARQYDLKVHYSDASKATELEYKKMSWFPIPFTVYGYGWDVKYDPNWGYYIDCIGEKGNKTLQEALDKWYELFLTSSDAVICISTDKFVKYFYLSINQGWSLYPDEICLNCQISDGKDQYYCDFFTIPCSSEVGIRYNQLLKIDEVMAANFIFKNLYADKTFKQIDGDLHIHPDVSKIAFKWVNK